MFWLVTVARDARGLFARRQPPRVLGDVNIEPTNLCNANCVFCGYQFQSRPWVPMPKALGEQIIDAAKRAGVGNLGLTPIVGDPLIHRELESFVRYAVAPPVPLTVGLTTNGILLTSARYRALVDAGVTTIDVSMSFPDEAEYRRIYRSQRLKTVLANIESILDFRRKGECDVRLSLRTPRVFGWDAHPVLQRARQAGWVVTRNFLFDDWSGRVSDGAAEEGLLIRPNRTKVLPCAMTVAGPHFLSDGRATACGCRDLDGTSQLALSSDDLLDDMRGTYEHGAVARIRQRFRDDDAPDVCQSCRHYNPLFEGEAISLRLRQLAADVRDAIRVERPGGALKPAVQKPSPSES